MPRENRINRESFQAKYLNPRLPVVLTDLARTWPATTRWTPEFLKTNYGDRVVKVYNATFAAPGKNYMSNLRAMRLDEYLQKVLHEDTDLRMFLYDMPAEIPELQQDVLLPTIADGFSRRFMFLFFGCRGSVTPIHYDIDMSHVFHTAIHGRKRIVLFSPEQSTRLYQHPFTVRSYVDVDAPNFVKFPKLAGAKGWQVILEPGETLFIPSAYWHHVFYAEGGYAISLRCQNEQPLKMVKGWLNLLAFSPIDRLMNRIMPESWFDWKEKRAGELAELLASVEDR